MKQKNSTPKPLQEIIQLIESKNILSFCFVYKPGSETVSAHVQNSKIGDALQMATVLLQHTIEMASKNEKAPARERAIFWELSQKLTALVGETNKKLSAINAKK